MGRSSADMQGAGEDYNATSGWRLDGESSARSDLWSDQASGGEENDAAKKGDKVMGQDERINSQHSRATQMPSRFHWAQICSHIACAFISI